LPKAARLGAPRNPAEGPLDFSVRATRLLPNESERIRRIANTYIALRYAPAPDPMMLEQFAKEVNAFAALPNLGAQAAASVPNIPKLLRTRSCAAPMAREHFVFS
jgi:hypothetical protein